MEEIKYEIDLISKFLPQTEWVFLPDGNALNLRTEKLVEILDYISHRFKGLNRISFYAMPKNLLQKSHSDLETLRDRGRGMLYVGIESGNDIVLKKATKGTPS